MRKRYTYNASAVILSASALVLGSVLALGWGLLEVESAVVSFTSQMLMIDGQARPIWITITQFGGPLAVVFFAALALLRRNRVLTLEIILYSAIGYIIMEALKHLIAKPRPATGFLYTLDVTALGYSFPSGHATIATILALLVVRYVHKRSSEIVAVWVMLVGLSRIVLGVHTPLDIIAGVALGYLVFVVLQAYVSPHLTVINKKK